MSTSFLRSLRLALLGVALTVLASCGGSSGGSGDNSTPAPVSNTPPDTASASVTGFIAYLKTLVATRQNTVEPLDVTTFVAPKSDNTEPDTTI